MDELDTEGEHLYTGYKERITNDPLAFETGINKLLQKIRDADKNNLTQLAYLNLHLVEVIQLVFVNNLGNKEDRDVISSRILENFLDESEGSQNNELLIQKLDTLFENDEDGKEPISYFALAHTHSSVIIRMMNEYKNSYRPKLN